MHCWSHSRAVCLMHGRKTAVWSNEWMNHPGQSWSYSLATSVTDFSLSVGTPHRNDPKITGNHSCQTFLHPSLTIVSPAMLSRKLEFFFFLKSACLPAFSPPFFFLHRGKRKILSIKESGVVLQVYNLSYSRGGGRRLLSGRVFV
jgi:hypothetical protein